MQDVPLPVLRYYLVWCVWQNTVDTTLIRSTCLAFCALLRVFVGLTQPFLSTNCIHFEMMS